jgi:hypothetical protein
MCLKFSQLKLLSKRSVTKWPCDAESNNSLHFTNCPYLFLTWTIAVASSICEDGFPLDVWQNLTTDWLLLFCSVLVGYGWHSLLQSLRLFFWAGLDSHGKSELCVLLQNLYLHSALHCAVLWLLPRQLGTQLILLDEIKPMLLTCFPELLTSIQGMVACTLNTWAVCGYICMLGLLVNATAVIIPRVLICVN